MNLQLFYFQVSLAPAIKGLKTLKLDNFAKLFIGLSLLVARILNQKSDAN